MLSTEQLTARQKFIGSSDAAAIVGVDSFKTATEVWLEKTGRIEPFAGNEATERGNRLEPALIDYACDKLGCELERSVFVTRTDVPELCANLDAFARNIPAPIEAKSTSIEEGWGEPGTDQVPERVTVQTHHQMFMVGPECRVAFVPLIVPSYRRFDWRMYRVDRFEGLAERIAEKCIRFMRENVVADVQPDPEFVAIDVLKRMRRVANKVVSVEATLVKEWSDMRNARLTIERAEERAASALLLAMGDAEGAKSEAGEVTYLPKTRKSYTVPQTTYRTLRLTTAKGKLS